MIEGNGILIGECMGNFYVVIVLLWEGFWIGFDKVI